MVDAELLKILVCPEDKSMLRELEAPEVERINAAIAAGTVRNRGGHAVSEPIDAGLLREDGRWCYPVRDEIPVMLVEEAIGLPLTG